MKFEIYSKENNVEGGGSLFIITKRGIELIDSVDKKYGFDLDSEGKLMVS